MVGMRTKIGDVFSVPLGASGQKYFQYIGNDLTQLNSDVIRAFRKLYPLDVRHDMREVVEDKVEFYAHVVIKWGIKMNLWKRVGTVPYLGRLNVLFRDSNDYGQKIGEEHTKISYNWRIWRANEEFQNIGRLTPEYQKAEIGIVVSPPNIVHRMRTGEYNFAYPGY